MGLFAKIVAWGRRNLPTRESMERHRLLRPVAHRVLLPELWRFTRRSVPRGVALGMVTGMLFPVAQIPLSALLALPFRANVPTAVATTFITNPFTTPPLWVAAYWIGHWILGFDAEIGQSIASELTANRGWLQWLVSEAGPSTIVGLFILTLSFAVVGYAASAFGWRWWVAHKWRSRHTRTTSPNSESRPLL
jgi:uncharacterized protein (DUF2062 family)